MKVIKPVVVTSAMLTTNIVTTVEPWVAGTYKKGDKRLANNHVFESLVDANTANPLKDDATPKWLDTGAENKMAMFDKGAAQVFGTVGSQRKVFLIGTRTVNSGTIDVTIKPGQVVNSVALFGLTGYRVTVTMTAPDDGEVYRQVISLVDARASGMWEWLFKRIGRKKTFALTDLPAYGDASIRIVIEADASVEATCAMACVGTLTPLGETVFGGTGFGLTDFSVKSVDPFGVEALLERGFRRRVIYDVRIHDEDLEFALDFLEDLRATGAVYIGHESRPATIIFGRYRDLQVTLPNPALHECALDVGGLL